MEEVYFFLDGIGCLNDRIEQFALSIGGNARQKGHGCRQAKVQGVDRSQGANPKILKAEHLLLCPEVFFDPPTAKVRACNSHDVRF